jgi:predicted ArsR family transcriptional regulator
MNQQKKRGRPAKVKAEVQTVEDVEQVDATHDAEAMDVIEDVEQPTQEQRIQSNPDQELVRRVEMEIGRTHNAWGMVDPVELINAFKRVVSSSY